MRAAFGGSVSDLRVSAICDAPGTGVRPRGQVGWTLLPPLCHLRDCSPCPPSWVPPSHCTLLHTACSPALGTQGAPEACPLSVRLSSPTLCPVGAPGFPTCPRPGHCVQAGSGAPLVCPSQATAWCPVPENRCLLHFVQLSSFLRDWESGPSHSASTGSRHPNLVSRSFPEVFVAHT